MFRQRCSITVHASDHKSSIRPDHLFPRKLTSENKKRSGKKEIILRQKQKVERTKRESGEEKMELLKYGETKTTGHRAKWKHSINS